MSAKRGEPLTPEEQALLIAAQLEGRLRPNSLEVSRVYPWRVVHSNGTTWCSSLQGVLQVLRAHATP